MTRYDRRRANSNSAVMWTWLVYAIGAFAVGLGLSYCTIQVLETAAKVAG
jgi:hypothetical protein